MKLQHLSVIFVIIIIPISLIMSAYIQNQIDTIVLQTSYTTSLTNATHDALKAFQINSANNKYSSISDSKIRDIEASINTFYNSLGTATNQYISSKEQLSGFVPAILFNLYDGYYIYSTYNNVYTSTGTGEDTLVEIEDNNNYQTGLRPYIYYSCSYNLNGRTIIVNFTLDNAITVYGDFGDGEGYVKKSGYLINPNYVTNINETAKTLTYNGVTIKPETLTEHLITINDDESISQGDYNYIIYNNKKVYEDGSGSGKYFWYDNYKKTYLQSEKANFQNYLNNNGVGFKSISAFQYYKEAKEFSEWVNNKLKRITQANIIQNDGTVGAEDQNGNLYLATNTADEQIFNTKRTDNDPMLSSSAFNQHRMSIIRKSIETNLTTAIANYNLQSGNNYEFVLPIIDEENWYKVVNNVSIISFMQGLPIGQKYYNNYSVITNTKNEEVINEQSVYVLARDGSGNLEYHQPGCKELIDKTNNGTITIEGTYTALGFLRQTVKITEANIHYFYPQSRTGKTTTGCYNCIVNASGDYDIDDIIKGEVKKHNYTTDQDEVIYNTASLLKVRTSYLTALARERYDLYKTSF